MASEKWKHFERLVAANHKAADQGAEVRWDEKIDGRQFDVTVRFKRGLYDYLTVVECRDYATPVPVSDVEAFVTKAKDARANCAVMASPNGFQSGAQDVAARHDMKLIQVTESSEVDPTIFGATWGDEIDALSMETVELEYLDGTKTKLPDQPNVMRTT
jgi:Restriction endonuclease